MKLLVLFLCVFSGCFGQAPTETEPSLFHKSRSLLEPYYNKRRPGKPTLVLPRFYHDISFVTDKRTLGNRRSSETYIAYKFRF